MPIHQGLDALHSCRAIKKIARAKAISRHRREGKASSLSNLSSLPASAAGSAPDAVSLAESELCVVEPPADAAASLSSSFSTSLSDVLAAENESLKRENAALKQRLQCGDDSSLKPGNPRPGVARVQAAARGHLARLGFYDPRGVLLPPPPPSVKAALEIVTFRDPEGEVASLPTIRVRLSVCPSEPAPKQRARASTSASASSPQRALAKDALVVGLSVIMGLLALAIMRNPRAARAAAAGAAATVAALVSRSKQRSEL